MISLSNCLRIHFVSFLLAVCSYSAFISPNNCMWQVATNISSFHGWGNGLREDEKSASVNVTRSQPVSGKVSEARLILNPTLLTSAPGVWLGELTMCLDFKLRFVSVLHFAITRSALTSSTWHRLCLPQSLPFYLPEKIGVPHLPSPSFPPAGSSSGFFVLWPAHSVNHSLFLPESRSCRLKVTAFAFVSCLGFSLLDYGQKHTGVQSYLTWYLEESSLALLPVEDHLHFLFSPSLARFPSKGGCTFLIYCSHPL